MQSWWDGLVDPGPSQFERLRLLHATVADVTADRDDPETVGVASRNLLDALLQRRPNGHVGESIPYTAAANPLPAAATPGSLVPHSGSVLPASACGVTERLQWVWCDHPGEETARFSSNDESGKPQLTGLSAGPEAFGATSAGACCLHAVHIAAFLVDAIVLSCSASAKPLLSSTGGYRVLPVRRTASLLVGVIDCPGRGGVDRSGHGDVNEGVSHRCTSGSAFIRLSSGTVPCVIEQPRPELRGALVWVPAWNVIRAEGMRGQTDTVASTTCSYTCAPAYLEIRDVVVLRENVVESSYVAEPMAMSVFAVDRMESRRRQSAFTWSACGISQHSTMCLQIAIACVLTVHVRAERRAHEDASAMPDTGLSLVGYLAAVSPVLLLRSKGKGRVAFYAHVADLPPASCVEHGRKVDTVTVLFDGPDATGWRAFLPSPASGFRVCITGLSRTRFETASLSQRLLVTSKDTAVRTASEGAGDSYHGHNGRTGSVSLRPPLGGASHSEGRPLLVTYHTKIGNYRGDGVWELMCSLNHSTGNSSRHSNTRAAGRTDPVRLPLLFLTQWPGNVLGLRHGASVVVHNAHPVYGRRGGPLHGLAASVYTSVDVLDFSTTDAPARVPSERCLWKWYWRRMAWDEVTWLMVEALPQFERKFRGLWSRAKLLLGSSETSADPPLVFALRSYERSRQSANCKATLVSIPTSPGMPTSQNHSSDAVRETLPAQKSEDPAAELFKPRPGGDVGTFFAQGFATCRQADGDDHSLHDGSWDCKPYIVTMAQLIAVADAMAAAVNVERHQTGDQTGWGYRRLSAEKVKQALGAVLGHDSSSCAEASQAAPLELMILGRLCGHGVAGGIVLADATGRVPVVFDATSELEACYSEQLWLVGALSLVVEYGPASAAVLTWYYALDLPSATCLFHRQPRTTDARSMCSVLPAFNLPDSGAAPVTSASVDSDAFSAAHAAPLANGTTQAGTAWTKAKTALQHRLWVILVYKSTLSSTPQQRRSATRTSPRHNPIGTGEPFFYADVEVLDVEALYEGRTGT